jgi:hypothetical protein
VDVVLLTLTVMVMELLIVSMDVLKTLKRRSLAYVVAERRILIPTVMALLTAMMDVLMI